MTEVASAPNGTAGPTPAPVTGVIYPPPSIRDVIDKTAQFVAAHGRSFEEKIRANLENEQNAKKFSFLRLSDPYHAYYELKIQQLITGEDGQEGPEEDNKADGAPPAAPAATVKPKLDDAEVSKEAKDAKAVTVARAPVASIAARAAKTMPKEPPPPEEFKIYHPQLSALDSDIIKLTAQYTAVGGRQFLSGLAAREQRNPQFDFLKPSHALFGYFTSLVDTYTKVLSANAAPQVRQRIKQAQENRLSVLDRCLHRLEWTRMEEERKKAAQAQEDADRMAFLSVDWHDFVVVETIDFKDADDQPAAPEANDMEMEMDMDESEEEEEPAKPIPAHYEEEENIRIVTDYKPQVGANKPSDAPQYMLDPAGRQIPLSEVGEHMRIELLDPKWREEEQRRRDKQKETSYAAGEAIAQNLQRLAKKRTDIFAAPEGEETAPSEPQKEKVTWDGFSSSIAATKAAAAAQNTAQPREDSRSNIGPSAHQQGGLSQGALPTPAPPSQQPRPPYGQGPPQHHPPPQQHGDHRGGPPGFMGGPPGMHGVLGNPYMQRGPPGMAPVPRPQMPMGMMGGPGHGLMGPPGGHPGGMMGPPGRGPPGGFMGPPGGMMGPPGGMGMGGFNGMGPGGQDGFGEPFAKRQRTDMGTIPEEEFAAMFNGPIMIRVRVPLDNSNAQWNMNGQILEVPVEVRSAVKVLKEKISEKLGNMPVNKIQLKTEAGFLKDAQTLAQLNLGQGSFVELSLRTRGGGKR